VYSPMPAQRPGATKTVLLCGCPLSYAAHVSLLGFEVLF